MTATVGWHAIECIFFGLFFLNTGLFLKAGLDDSNTVTVCHTLSVVYNSVRNKLVVYEH